KVVLSESFPPIVENKCSEFARNFVTCNHTQLPQVLIHDGKWKKSNKKLAEVTSRILEILNNSWNNLTFGLEHAESLNERTYVTNMIVPAIQASLKNLLYGKNCYISIFKRQSIASSNRKGEERLGRRPDIIFVIKNKGKKYELMYSECLHLFCTSQKIDDNAVKLWCKTNNRPLLRLTVLIRDGASVDQYYYLHELEISVQYSDSNIVAEFIKTLLILYNILTLILYGSLPKSERQKENSLTIDSDSD
ncbi:12949_t:CDS:2, partial [Dentiscutata erythropus]